MQTEQIHYKHLVFCVMKHFEIVKTLTDFIESLLSRLIITMYTILSFDNYNVYNSPLLICRDCFSFFFDSIQGKIM